jgi:hypothetical protein
MVGSHRSQIGLLGGTLRRQIVIAEGKDSGGSRREDSFHPPTRRKDDDSLYELLAQSPAALTGSPN